MKNIREIEDAKLSVQRTAAVLRSIVMTVGVSFCVLFSAFLSSCKKNIATTEVTQYKIIHSQSILTGFKVVRLSGGSYAVAAHDPRNNSKCHIIGISETGDRQWEQQISDSVTVTDIAATPDNGLIICGYNNKSAIIDHEPIFLTRYNASGNIDWATTIYTYSVYYLCMAVAPDGSIYLNMSSALAGFFPSNFLFRFSPAGQLVKTTQATGITPDSLLCFPLNMVFSGNEMIITGAATWYTDPGHTSLNSIYLLGDFCFNMDTSGNVKWLFNQLDSFAVGQALTVASSGNTVADIGSSSSIPMNYQAGFVNGGREYSLDRGNMFQDIADTIMVRLFDTNTGVMQTKLITLPDFAESPCISATSDNGYIITARDNLAGKVTKILLAKTSSNLDVQWTKQINIPYATNAFGVFQDADGGYVVFSTVQSFNTNKDIAFIKTDANGNLK